MRSDGWLDVGTVTARWRDHLAGGSGSTQAIWAVLMFQAWLRDQQAETGAAL